jgi:hypothetical protein
MKQITRNRQSQGKRKNLVRLKRNPNFEAGFDPKPDMPSPLEGINEDGDLQDQADEGLAAVRDALRAAHAHEYQTTKLAMDSEYWCALVFKSSDQKDAFLAAMDWARHGDKYLDGVLIASLQGIELPEANLVYGRTSHRTRLSKFTKGGDS